MDDKELDKKLEELKASSDKLRQEMEAWEKLYTQMGLSGSDLKKKLVQLATTTEESRRLFKKSASSGLTWRSQQTSCSARAKAISC